MNFKNDYIDFLRNRADSHVGKLLENNIEFQQNTKELSSIISKLEFGEYENIEDLKEMTYKCCKLSQFNNRIITMYMYICGMQDYNLMIEYPLLDDFINTLLK